jgi:PTS system ascorbate-specific IIA component
MVIKNSLIKNNSLQIIDEVSSWEEAIKVAVTPLIESGAVENRYYDAMIEVTKDKGPYYIIGENIAMPHSRPENGVNETAFAFLLLKKAIDFNVEGYESREADILFVLAAEESGEDVQEAITELLTLVENSKKLKKLRNSTKIEEILTLLD